MATYHVDPTNGNDADDGLSWANAFATLNGAEDEPVAAGDKVYVGPGVYREELTVDVSGGNTYSTGTVAVTNGSDQVTGNGTTFGGNVAAGYYFHVRYYDNGADGVTNGDNSFTAAGGNFHANLVGCPIQINTKGAYTIAAVAAANSLTLADPHALGWPGAGGGLTYSIMSGEGHHEIESVDGNTTITLVQPWQGRTLTGLSYLTFNAITYIADVTGEHTDGVGGVVRITGSDNDQTAARGWGILGSGDDYRVFRGFYLDMVSNHLILGSDCDYWLVEDCVFSITVGVQLSLEIDAECATARRCYFMPLAYAINSVYCNNGADQDDSGHVVENCLFTGWGSLHFNNVGGGTVRNCLALSVNYGVRVDSLTIGQTILVNNCATQGCFVGVGATAAGSMLTEDYNSFFGNNLDRWNVAVGANSVTYPVLLNPLILHAGAAQLSGFKFPWLFGELSEWSQIAAIAGVDERNTDLFGVTRPATAAKNSWGAVQFHDRELESGTVQAGSYSRVLHDAGSVLFRRIPITGVEITVTLYMRRETNYAGNLPWMVIKQPGQADRTTVMTAAVDTWEQLSDTLTPASPPGFIEVWVESRNTAAAGAYEVFYDTMGVA